MDKQQIIDVIGGLGMKTLETERLILRNWKETDLDDFYEYASVEGVGETAGWPTHTDKSVTKTILNQFIDEDEVYALVLKENNKVIGSLGIHKRTMDEDYKAPIQREIGYVLSRTYWGNGLVAEAVKKVIGYAFENMKVDVLWCGHFSFNNRSRRVVEKCGFKFYADGIYHAELLNKTFELKKYLLTKEDYKTMLIDDNNHHINK